MKINIKHIAKLAEIPITAEEGKKLEKELEATLEHVDRLREINTANVVGTNEVVELVNVLREDEIKPSLSQEDALKNAKKIYNGLFVVPIIIEEAIEK
ncbi:MAG: Asp-tRNA(Asn)/Glu-tRNA(Gln) amidotransferase subunit GatC [Patescibacteria group bacterium]|nr:Asp-tRNA(Asn)/Glu-tRNA(Gln) amidotransferase subunit GatC [Patescibacteria group bacterium]MDE2590360.1 Asp-tRNA(Asn)/Glu-tRNA(Gln) amidotransferase subunit GatC [Patescibacteria group bacterium]